MRLRPGSSYPISYETGGGYCQHVSKGDGREPSSVSERLTACGSCRGCEGEDAEDLREMHVDDFRVDGLLCVGYNDDGM